MMAENIFFKSNSFLTDYPDMAMNENWPSKKTIIFDKNEKSHDQK